MLNNDVGVVKAGGTNGPTTSGNWAGRKEGAVTR